MTRADLVTIFRGGDEPGLSRARSLLEGAGIPYVTKATGVQDLFGAGRAGLGYSAVTGPPEILVRAEDAGRARELLDLHPGEISEQELAELAERTPPQEEEPGPPVGMSGLLMVMGAMAVLLPIWLCYDLVDTLINMSSKSSTLFATPGTPHYHPAWPWYRVVLPMADAALLLGSLFVFELFRSKDWRFPRAMALLLCAEFLSELADLLVRTWMGLADWRDFRDVQRVLGAAALCAICFSCLDRSDRGADPGVRS